MAVAKGRKEYMDNMVDTLQTFDVGSWEEAERVRGGSTARRKMQKVMSSWDVDSWIADFKPRREGLPDDLYATTPPLEAKKALVRKGHRKSQGQKKPRRI